MQDIEVIDRFKQQISWGNETEIIQFDGKTMMATDRALYVPMHCEQVNFVEAKILGVIFEREAVALIWGNPSDERATAICQASAYSKAHVSFIDATGQLAWSDFVCRALDGIDWQRSFEAVVKDGKEARPVWQWEE